MAKIKVENISNLSKDELQVKLQDATIRLQKLKFAHAITPLENPMQISIERKNIARINTAINK